VAVGLTVAKMLYALRGELHGRVKFMFQPAEEGQGGAESMIAAGVLQSPAPKVALGLHVWNEMPVGWMGVPGGPMMAGGEIFEVTLTGKGGHGALPHQAIDPVLAGAQIVTALQGIVARNVSPFKSAVVSVTQFHTGDAFNIIPQTAQLRGTIRTFELDVREMVIARFKEVVEHVAAANRCMAEIHVNRLTPAVINDEKIAGLVAGAIRQSLPDVEVSAHYQTTGSEDFAYVLEKVPGCFFFVGSKPVDVPAYPHHHPRFAIDEKALVLASAAMTSAVVELMK